MGDLVVFGAIFGAFFVTINQALNWVVRVYDRGKARQ